MNRAPIHIFQLITNQACAPYRMVFPGESLDRTGDFKVTRLTGMDDSAYGAFLKDGDILIVQRLPMSPMIGKMFSHLNRMGKLILFDIDDDLLHLNPDSAYAKQAGDDFSIRIRESISASHAVQCSSNPLAEVISEIHPETAVLENQLDMASPLPDDDLFDRPIRIGYAGGEDHLGDWETIRDTFNEVMSKLESDGHQTETWIIGEKAMFDSLRVRNKRYFPLLPRDQYMAVLRQIDVSLIPLADNPFNRCKSDVKYLESAASGAAVLASQVVYGKTVIHEETGYLFDNAERFGRQLERLVRTPRLIRPAAEKAHEYVSKHRLVDRHIGKWQDTYKEWFKRRHELFFRV